MKSRIEPPDYYSGMQIAYTKVSSLLGCGMWSVCFDDSGKQTQVIFNDDLRHMLGYKDVNDFPNEDSAWYELLHPEDKIRIRTALNDMINDTTGKTTYNVEYRIRAKNSSYKWVKATGDIYRNEKGIPIRFWGMIIDIDIQKKCAVLEQKLRSALDEVKETNQAMLSIQEQYDIINALSNDYLNIYAVYPEKDCADVIKLDGYVVDGLSEISKAVPYTQTFERYIKTRVHPDDIANLMQIASRENIIKSLKTSSMLDFTYRTLVNDEVHYFNVRYTRVSKAQESLRIVVGFRCVDSIVEKENAHKVAIEEAKALLLIHESLGSGNWTMEFDAKGQLARVIWSQRFRVMLGFNDTNDFPDSLEAWTTLIHPDYKEKVLQQFWGTIRDFTGQKIYDVKYPCRTKNGSYIWVHDACRLSRRVDGSPDILYGIFIDIDSDVKKDKALKDALIAAEHANNAKTIFLNNMSHDIRTPMNAIIGFTTLAATHIDSAPLVQDYLAKIQTSSNHLLSLINDVLDMARIESGKVQIELKPSFLPDILHDLKTIVQDDITSRQLDFFIDTEDITCENIVCDKLRLNQVLLNLISNSMKFTKPGGMVAVKVSQVECTKSGYASYLFEIKDSGIGIAKDFLPHVFEPFEREKNSTVSGIPGTGLGLSITKNIIDMMGGKISVKSKVGSGTTFTVALDFKTAGEPLKIQPIKELEGLRALVVDDDFSTCATLVKMLNKINMRCDWTTYGKEAILRATLALEQHDAYCAYIIDWLMPDMNGIEVIRRIRQKVGDTALIIILTAYDFSDIEEEARQAGVSAFCSKPIFFSELYEILQSPFSDKPHKSFVKQTLALGNHQKKHSGKTLLLVEDNALNQEIATAILLEAGFKVESADNGKIALEMLENAPKNHYAAILMDIQMPIMSGYEATKNIRAFSDKEKSTIPIIAMTANAFEEDKQKAIDCGMNGYIAKPIDIKKMLDLLEKVIS